MPELKFHEPTGAVPPPFVLVEGEEKSGKSTRVAKFTGCDRVGQSYWFELGSGERTGEWYIRVKGAKYKLANPEAVRTWRGLNEQIDAVAEDVEKRLAAGEKTPVIIIDSMTAEWKSLSKWAEWKARNSKSAKKILANDPNAEIPVSSPYWNAATARHEDLLAKLSDIPAIIIFTARGKEVTEFDKAGQPIANRKTWSVVAQKDLGFFVDIWTRLRRGAKAEIVGCRSVNEDGIIPGEDDVEKVAELDLEHLIFERYGFDPDNTVRRPKTDLDSNQVMPGEDGAEEDGQAQEVHEETLLAAMQLLDEAEKATTRAEMDKVWADGKTYNLMRVPIKRVELHVHLMKHVERIKASMVGQVNGQPVGIGS